MKVFEALLTRIVLIKYNDVKHPKGLLLPGFNLLGPDQEPRIRLHLAFQSDSPIASSKIWTWCPLRTSVVEDMRQSYIPQGIDMGIALGLLPLPGENGCMVAEQVLSVQETCDVFERSLVIAVMKL
jgi:hypothetical protein